MPSTDSPQIVARLRRAPQAIQRSPGGKTVLSANAGILAQVSDIDAFKKSRIEYGANLHTGWSTVDFTHSQWLVRRRFAVRVFPERPQKLFLIYPNLHDEFRANVV